MECRAMPCLPLKLARNVGSVAFRFRRTSCVRGPFPEEDLARATLSRRMAGWAADPVALWMETPSPPKPNPLLFLLRTTPPHSLILHCCLHSHPHS